MDHSEDHNGGDQRKRRDRGPHSEGIQMTEVHLVILKGASKAIPDLHKRGIKILEQLGIEPRTSPMLREHYTTKPQPH
jgi:hypothetical protein